ncbi:MULTISPECIES: hypothetical protein [unclassified Nocardiopsis]|uniref:hypothetical protein n=1 Tax=unclassified Nocardiopsis TaxID=2649073 RepID=UPI00135718C0|nr:MULTISPECIES: hypothetical protein [unclassified Nocardiopsis]
MANIVRICEDFLYRHRWVMVPLWLVGVVVVGGGGLFLLMGSYMATANGAHPWSGPLLSIALYLLYAALPVSLLHLVLVWVGPRARLLARIVGALLLLLVLAAFGATDISTNLEPA